MKQWLQNNWFKPFLVAVLILIIFLIARSIYLHPERTYPPIIESDCTDANCFRESVERQAKRELLGKCRRGELPKQLCENINK